MVSEYWANFLSGVSYYTRFYIKFAGDCWSQIEPVSYLIILISIAVFGWILMKTASLK